MDTTQKNREEAAQRRPRQEAAAEGAKRTAAPRQRTQKEAGNRRPAPQDAPPVSAQQNNGAARTAEEQQRTAAAQPRQPRPKQAAKKPQSAPKKAASAPKTPAKKTAAPRKKRPARQAEPEDISTKKRAYGNSKPKKKTGLAALADSVKQSAQRSSARKKAKTDGKGKKRPQQPTPAVIYTQPQAFNRNRFLVQLLTAVAIVVALVMCLSVFFKVETITISGAEVYSAWSVREASGIEEGDGLLTFSRARAGALIKANLPYVKDVRFGIKLPDTVNIIIDEEDVVYAIKDQDSSWWLINSDGRVVEQSNSGKAANYTQILGVTLDNPTPNEKGIATEYVPTETDDNGEIIPVTVTVTGAQKLTAVLQILQALEANDIVGDAASVDVTRLEDIILWYGTRYQVNLGDSTRLEYKITCMNDAILQLSDFDSGILDISFTIWPTQVGYTPFS